MEITRAEQKDLSLFLVLALVGTFILAYIDEGNYNFHWMKDRGSWIAVLLYTTFFFTAQLFVYKVVLHNMQSGMKRVLLTPLLAIAVLLVFLFLMK